MNLKISHKGFRFRIDPTELGRLLEGQTVEQMIPLGGGRFFYRIAPVSDGEDLKIDAGANGIFLSAPRVVLERLRDTGPSKDGVIARQGDVEVCLQVDLRASRENRAA